MRLLHDWNVEKSKLIRVIFYPGNAPMVPGVDPIDKPRITLLE